ncbi:TVP38/TMEM64 family protein, partial [Candidatus Omnitrophota bacterium]
LVLCWLAGKYFSADIDYYKEVLSGFPPLVSHTIFVLLYVAGSFFIWVIKDPLKVVGAFLFGVYVSTFLIWIAEMINAVILFNLSRRLGRNFVESKLQGGFANLDKKIGHSGFWGVFALRAIILIPYRVLDLVAGLTSMSFRQYFLAVAFGSPLRIFIIQFVLGVISVNFFQEPALFYKEFQGYLVGNPAILIFGLVYTIAIIMTIIFWGRSFVNKKEQSRCL